MKKNYNRVVVKIGSNVLSREDGSLNVTQVSSLVDQIARLHRAGVEVIVVSSGAVASGRGEIGKRTGKLDQVSARQLFSAVGQAKLINRYYDLFRDWDIVCGQVLTTKDSLSTRVQYLNQRNCMDVMLANNVIPVINENDTISVTGLMFTDNDELSGMVSSMMDAEALIILSNIDGIFDGNPKSPESKVIRRILPEGEGDDISQYIQVGRSQFGRGGMLTKSRISQKVADEGIEVIIANGLRDDILTDLVLSDKDVICTRFLPADTTMSGVKRWIAHSDGFAKGELHINEGAYEALLEPDAVSLLPIGVTKVEGEFEKDDIVLIVEPKGEVIGVGRVSVDSEEARQQIGKKGCRPFIHYDYMYLENI